MPAYGASVYGNHGGDPKVLWDGILDVRNSWEMSDLDSEDNRCERQETWDSRDVEGLVLHEVRQIARFQRLQGEGKVLLVWKSPPVEQLLLAVFV